MIKTFRALLGRFFSPGALIVLCAAVVSSILVALLPVHHPAGIIAWVAAKPHFESYQPLERAWNLRHPREQFNIQLINAGAMERRMLAGFLSGTPTADIIEPNITVAAKAFLGPLQDIGFVDLTSRIRSEGLYQAINTPSFSPYTTRGHIFGLPHDVHPVLLAYRADIVEAAGIDVSKIHTWDDYFRIMRPLMVDLDGDGRPDRFLLSGGVTRGDFIAALLLQAGGTIFDAQDRPWLNNPRNAQVIARIVTWCAGPGKVCIDINPANASGHQQDLEGLSIGTLMPDWLAGVWKLENPRIGGKLKLMPLPAWEPGGLRTSVMGGTMIGIAKTSRNIDACWQFIKYLYLSPAQAERLFRVTDIVSPVKAIWSEKFYDEPDPFFSGQPTGRLYINQAPHVPARSSSPYMNNAVVALVGVAMDVRTYADSHHDYDLASLTLQTQRRLDQAQDRLQRFINRNAFLQPAP